MSQAAKWLLRDGSHCRDYGWTNRHATNELPSTDLSTGHKRAIYDGARAARRACACVGDCGRGDIRGHAARRLPRVAAAARPLARRGARAAPARLKTVRCCARRTTARRGINEVKCNMYARGHSRRRHSR